MEMDTVDDIRNLAGGILSTLNQRPRPRSPSVRSTDSAGLGLCDDCLTPTKEGGTVVGITRPDDGDADESGHQTIRRHSEPDLMGSQHHTARLSSRDILEGSQHGQGSQHGSAAGSNGTRSVDVQSILDDIANPRSEIDAANALLAIAPSFEDIKDQLSYYDSNDEDSLLDDEKSLTSRRSNRSLSSKRSNTSRRSLTSVGSRRSIGSRGYGARRVRLGSTKIPPSRKRSIAHGLPLPKPPSSIPKSERPPMTIQIGSGKSDKGKEIEVPGIDDDDALDPENEQIFPAAAKETENEEGTCTPEVSEMDDQPDNPEPTHGDIPERTLLEDNVPPKIPVDTRESEENSAVDEPHLVDENGSGDGSADEVESYIVGLNDTECDDEEITRLTEKPVRVEQSPNPSPLALHVVAKEELAADDATIPLATSIPEACQGVTVVAPIGAMSPSQNIDRVKVVDQAPQPAQPIRRIQSGGAIQPPRIIVQPVVQRPVARSQRHPAAFNASQGTSMQGVAQGRGTRHPDNQPRQFAPNPQQDPRPLQMRPGRLSPKVGSFAPPGQSGHSPRLEHQIMNESVIQELKQSGGGPPERPRQRGKPSSSQRQMNNHVMQPTPLHAQQSNHSHPQGEETSTRSSRSRDSVRSPDALVDHPDSYLGPHTGNHTGISNVPGDMRGRDLRQLMRPVNHDGNAQQWHRQVAPHEVQRHNPLSAKPNMSREQYNQQMARNPDAMRMKSVAQIQEEQLRRVDHRRGMRPLLAELTQRPNQEGEVERHHHPGRHPSNMIGRNLPPPNARYKNGIPMWVTCNPFESGRSVSPYSAKDDKEMDLNEMTAKLLNYDHRDPGLNGNDLNTGSFHRGPPNRMRPDRLSMSGHDGEMMRYGHSRGVRQLNSRQFGR